ncbi:hypothetical protein TNCV_2371591 [Trichonephila clavipes]|nr:hypothetical protein TNCV_2371591 [Trichonephila clavipes]
MFDTPYEVASCPPARGYNLSCHVFTEGVSLSRPADSTMYSCCLCPMGSRGAQHKGAVTHSFLPIERFHLQSSAGREKRKGGGDFKDILRYSLHVLCPRLTTPDFFCKTSFLLSLKKEDLIVLATELRLVISLEASLIKSKIKEMIVKSPDYVERIRKEAAEKEEKLHGGVQISERKDKIRRREE